MCMACQRRLHACCIDVHVHACVCVCVCVCACACACACSSAGADSTAELSQPGESAEATESTEARVQVADTYFHRLLLGAH